MPLLDIECSNGHLSEVLKRGGVTAPLLCPECGAEGKRRYSTFSFVAMPDTFYEPGYVGKVDRYAPAVIARMGGGKASKTAEGGYRPALTHNGVCPQCARRRNVAVLGELALGLRLMCEACGYLWLHHAPTASDPLFAGVDESFRPGKSYSAALPTGSGYQAPERAA